MLDNFAPKTHAIILIFVCSCGLLCSKHTTVSLIKMLAYDLCDKITQWDRQIVDVYTKCFLYLLYIHNNDVICGNDSTARNL